MIIRHDLKLVFIHVPKCAGKQVRELLKIGGNKKNLTELWNYNYSEIMHRYVDMAHLPLSDLHSTEYFDYLKKYKVIACCRNPYKRLTSAANEYYRQKSKEHEILVKDKMLTNELKDKYYKSLPHKHHELDPRYIHSLPIHYFTHYGSTPYVDRFMKCESLKDDFLQICKLYNLPKEIEDACEATLVNGDSELEIKKYSKKEIRIANELYSVDFETFGYIQYESQNKKQRKYRLAGNVKSIHNKNEIRWHWGPTALKPFTKLERTRA